MYSLDQFLKYANEYRDTKIKEEVIEEAEEYRADEEERLRELDELSRIGEALAKSSVSPAAFASVWDQQSNLARIGEALAKSSESYAAFASIWDQQSKLSTISEAIGKSPNSFISKGTKKKEDDNQGSCDKKDDE